MYPRSYLTQLKQLRKESLKKNSGKKKGGIEPMTSALPVQCSTVPIELSSQLGAGHIVSS